VFFAISSMARAVLLQWDGQTWTPGTLSNSFDVDPSNPGNDVTVTVSGDTGQLQPSLAAGSPQTPTITRAFDGGLSPGHNTLELALNLANNTQSVTITISFSNLYPAGVANVSFKLFDIDFANSGGSTYQDVVKSITATSTTGATIAPTITGVGPNVALSGSGANQVLTGMVSTVDTGPGSGDGNATISFNATDISSITFNYSSGAMFADPTYQHIGIDDIDYSVVPEFNPAWLTYVGCALLIVWTHRRRKKTKRRE
jgi:hypothetical protein